MKKILALVGALLLLLPMAAPASAAIECSGHPGVRLYADVEYRGASILTCFPNNAGQIMSLGNGMGFNDRVSSYKVLNCSNSVFRIYPDTQLRGAPYYLTTTAPGCNVPDVGIYWQSHWGDGFNDQASSMELWRR